jgi:BirA family biotin operon repressor/biotin-[acetyl-CoA-carboxylase] ligase
VTVPSRNRADVWPFVRTLIAYEEVDSTSDRAADLVRAGIVELPLAVWARRQTRGRGRRTHSWWSDEGSLTCTLAIDPAAHGLTVEAEPRLALATAVAVIAALDELQLGPPSAGIRWPNDLEVDGRKFGGILPERIEMPSGHRILMGVGINVRTDLAGAPADVRPMATSLAAQHPPGSVDERVLPGLFSAILRHFESVLTRLAAHDGELAQRWNQRDLLRNRWVSVDQGTHIVSGWGRGIDDRGALCLEVGGRDVRILGGQVLRPNSSSGA